MRSVNRTHASDYSRGGTGRATAAVYIRPPQDHGRGLRRSNSRVSACIAKRKWRRRAFIISCGYRHDVIQDYFGSGGEIGVQIEYAIEREKLGTGGGLKLALGAADASDPFILATNGDILTDMDISSIVDVHVGGGNTATISLTQLQSPYGIVESNEAHKVTAFHEKPLLPYWLSAGIYALSPAIRDLLPDKGDHERKHVSTNRPRRKAWRL